MTIAIISDIFINFASKFRKMENILLGTTVGKFRNRLHRIMKLRYAAEAEVKLTVEEFMILNILEVKPNQILQDIAVITGKNKSVVMRMIDSLEKKGLCRRTVNPVDRRENFLNITPEGERVVAQYQEIERRLSQELTANISEEKLKTFFDVIGMISENAKEP